MTSSLPLVFLLYPFFVTFCTPFAPGFLLVLLPHLKSVGERALIPSWLLQAGLSLLHGKTPQLTSAHLAMIEIGGIVALAALFCLAFIVLQVKNRLGTSPMYDMRLVDEKTARPAYRVRLRLFVFS